MSALVRRSVSVALLLLCFVAWQPLCFGQAFTANLTGLITDPSGGATSGVSVKIVNTATKEERQSSTGIDGRYTFSQLLPGDYELTAHAPGFQTFVESHITLVANQSAAVDFALQLGEVTQRVEVAGQAVQVDTQTANQSVTLVQNLVQGLPINNRNPLLLVFATAGVVSPTEGMPTSTLSQNYDRFGFNGGRSTTTQILLDGLSVQAGNGWNGLILSPSEDSVAELQVIRNTYDAQYGRSGGGVVSMVTKAGAENFHGTAFDYLRNSDMDATSWENNKAGVIKPIYQRNQFGGNFSGPIWKSKRLFFFGGYEGLRQGTPDTSSTGLPTDQERQGNFSNQYLSNGSLDVIYNPFSTTANASGGYTRTAFPGNIIPASMFDPVGVKTVALYAEPNNPGQNFTHALDYVATAKAIALNDVMDVRVDWVKSEKWNMYGRFSKALREETLPPTSIWLSFGSSGPIVHDPRQQLMIGSTYIPSPTWVVNFTVGHGSWTEHQRSNTYGESGTTIGLPASLVNQFDVETIPQIWMTGTQYSNISHSRELKNIDRVDNLQVNTTKEKGKHSIRFGLNWESDKNNGPDVFSADFYFNNGMTSGPTPVASTTSSGDGIASMLLGTGSQGDVPKLALLAYNRLIYSPYVQDTWRVTNRLTISPGLRYDLQKPPTERFNRLSNFAYNVANPLGAAVGMPLEGGLVYLNGSNRYSWNPDYRDFAPRIGAAYKLTDKMVMRGGYGVFYPSVLGQGDNTGFSNTTAWQTSVGGDGIHPLNLFSNPYPNGLIPPTGSSLGLETDLGGSLGGFTRNNPNGYMQNYSVDVQYQISRDTVVQVGYAGNVGRKLVNGITLNDNQLSPSLLSLGNKLDQQVANPFYGHIPTTCGCALSGATIPFNYLLRPFPEFGSVNLSSSGGSSSFNAMVVQFRKQLSNGFLLLSSVQWAKGIDNVAETEPSQTGTVDIYRNYYDIGLERSLSPNDQRYDFVTTFLYDLPFGRGRHFGVGMPKYVDAVLGGWRTSLITRFAQGFPVDMSASSSLSLYGFASTTLPNLTGQPVTLADRTPHEWFNTAAFSTPAAYTIGTAPRRIDQLREDGQHNADLAIMKDFRFRERLRAEFRGELFNMTNTPQFSWPNTSVGSSTFGQVTATTPLGPRNVQLSVKVTF